jgi:hypothetical protein
MLDRDCCPVTGQLQQLHIIFIEQSGHKRSDVEDAERAPAGHQRHAEHRLDPLLAQQWIEDVGVIDVIEDHRFPLGSDPTGETTTDRDTNTTLDLFLDSDSSARNELVDILIDEQHGAGVRIEDVADPRKEHCEQLVKLEVRERRIRDRLHVLDPLAGLTLRLEGPRMLDRDRRTVTGKLQQLDIVFVERPVHKRSHVEDAEHAAADKQRHSEHRLDPLLAQKGIEDVCVIDVVEDHRMPIRCDTSGETTADRDPNPAFDFLFDADRRPRDQLVRLLIQQQDCAGVDTEDLASAEKERRQESVELQVRERRVGQRLKLSQTVGVLDAIPLYRM